MYVFAQVGIKLPRRRHQPVQLRHRRFPAAICSPAIWYSSRTTATPPPMWASISAATSSSTPRPPTTTGTAWPTTSLSETYYNNHYLTARRHSLCRQNTHGFSRGCSFFTAPPVPKAGCIWCSAMDLYTASKPHRVTPRCRPRFRPLPPSAPRRYSHTAPPACGASPTGSTPAGTPIPAPSPPTAPETPGWVRRRWSS